MRGAVDLAMLKWTEVEPGWREFVDELRRLYRRNRARPAPLLIVVALCGLAGFLFAARWKPSYEARIALRLTEHDVGVTVAPRPIGELRGFVADVALSDRVLERVINKFQLYPQKRARGLDQALEALREDIGVEAWRNEFLVEDADDVGRSARVALRYAHGDPEVAWGVVEALAEATVAEQRRVRRAQTEYLAMGLEPALVGIEDKIREARQHLGAATSGSVIDVQRRIQLAADLEDLEHQRREISEKRTEAQLRLRAETLNLGLRTDIIDSTRPQRRSQYRFVPFVGAALGLLIGLILGSLTLQIFDRRIYGEEDLERLGFSLCGILPAYPGDGVGSMRSRVRMNKR